MRRLQPASVADDRPDEWQGYRYVEAELAICADFFRRPALRRQPARHRTAEETPALDGPLDASVPCREVEDEREGSEAFPNDARPVASLSRQLRDEGLCAKA